MTLVSLDDHFGGDVGQNAFCPVIDMARTVVKSFADMNLDKCAQSLDGISFILFLFLTGTFSISAAVVHLDLLETPLFTNLRPSQGNEATPFHLYAGCKISCNRVSLFAQR